PDHEEGRLHTFRCEGLENGGGVTRYRTIVERQHDLMIVKRQRFRVLHGTDTGMLSRVNHECAAGPERARWALLGICPADQRNENGTQRNEDFRQIDPVTPLVACPLVLRNRRCATYLDMSASC